MSLLNDALKRASQIQPELDTVRISLPPAAQAPKPQTGLGWALPVLIILLIVTSGAFVTLAFFARKAKVAPAPQIARAATVPTPARPFPAAPKPKIISSSLVAPKLGEGGSSNPAQTYSPPPPVERPLKVQGITYSNAKWQAIVNGTTVYVGDSINGFRIAAIYRNHVSFIAPDGSRKLVPFGY